MGHDLTRQEMEMCKALSVVLSTVSAQYMWAIMTTTTIIIIIIDSIGL